MPGDIADLPIEAREWLRDVVAPIFAANPNITDRELRRRLKQMTPPKPCWAALSAFAAQLDDGNRSRE